MANLPILLIQLRRLGDLIMTFPLLESLCGSHPANPLLFAGEEIFFSELKRLAPAVEFLPASSLPRLAAQRYELLVNLDSRREAAMCASKASANLKIGPQLSDSQLHISGFWQLYKASLTHNNRHNLFHWADLDRLDLVWPLPEMKPIPTPHITHGRVGLFIGASEAAKRPGAQFWSALARLLISRGLAPVILGGSAEKEAGHEISSRAGLEKANFCGKTSLTQLASIIRGLDLLISPDTGPMHLADWLGTPVLNLSMGNVNPHETGPMRPGHLVLRANMSCGGCWQCSRAKPYCHNAFNPALVSRIALAFLQDGLMNHEREFSRSGLELFRSARKANGLYWLDPIFVRDRHEARTHLDQFWQEAFLSFCDYENNMESLALRMVDSCPALAKSIQQNMLGLISKLMHLAKGGKGLQPDFWKSLPAHSRLFGGFLEMSLENDNFSPNAISKALEWIAKIWELFTHKS